MIDSISIENFRCFDKLKIKGFKSINLIGGQNNSGKTALLEALLLSFKPSGNTIDNLRLFRNENGNQIRKNNGKVWNYFFYNQDKSQTIKIVTTYDGKDSTNLELWCTNDVEAVLQSLSKILGNGNETKYESMLRNFSNNSLLNVRGSNLVKDFNYFIIPNKEKGDLDYIGNVQVIYSDSQSFLPSSRRTPDDYLAELYSLTKENKKIKILNEILNILDNRIIGSEIDAPGGEPVIKLLLNDSESFPLAMFGDAVRKITELILILLNTSSKVLFIDEIENGIHFTKHKELWTKLFQIVGNDIQIFATTHSFEMIKAFNDVAHQSEFEDKAMYFEMARTQKTHRLITNPIDMEMLKYKISFDRTFRGE